VLFGLAVLHTFCVKRFAHWAHRYPPGSVQEKLLHFLAETEVVFGLWAVVLFLGIEALKGSIQDTVKYTEGLNFTEPKFVFVIMVVAATRPVVRLAETLIALVARLIPAKESVAFYLAALFLGPLPGSFITEPAAMTLPALLLKRRYFDRGISRMLAYATLRLLFVNVSIGGTLTHFAAPPRADDHEQMELGHGVHVSTLRLAGRGRVWRIHRHRGSDVLEGTQPAGG
jgi:hypothetical protein